MKRPLVRLAAFGVVLAAAAAPALAVPPDMTAIELPVTSTSMVTVITAAGATILIASFGVMIGFAFAKKLFRRLKGAV